MSEAELVLLNKDGEELQLVDIECGFCHKTRRFAVSKEQLDKLMDPRCDENIQTILHNLRPAEIEMFTATRMCGACWNATFGNDEEDEYDEV